MIERQSLSSVPLLPAHQLALDTVTTSTRGSMNSAPCENPFTRQNHSHCYTHSHSHSGQEGNNAILSMSPSSTSTGHTHDCEYDYDYDSESVMCSTILLTSLTRNILSYLPRRNQEPTGWIDCVFDLILSLFINKGASEDKIKKLDVVPWNKKNMNQSSACPICLCSFEEGDQVTVLQCTHSFCKDCIELWLLKRNLCPMCKSQPC